jgi:chemotaxis-related protein WspB
MMMLLFRIDDDRYGVDIADIVELLPQVPLQKLPKAPGYLSGLLNYRGKIIPVIDLPMLIAGRPVKPLLSSRIILIKPDKNDERCFGLLSESVTETVKIADEDFTTTGIDDDTNTFVDKVAMDEHGMIQLVNLTKLLPNEVKKMMQDDEGQEHYREGGPDVV